MIRSQREITDAKHPVSALTHTDKLVLRYNESRDWAASNQRTMIGAGVVLVLVVAGLFYYSSTRAKDNELANTYLTRVSQFYANGDYRSAVDGDKNQRVQGEVIHGLKQIVDDYGSTPAGANAALLLANAYYYLGKYDSADMAFGKATTATPIMAASVDAGHAAVFEAKGNKEEAAKLFQNAAKRDKDNPMNADYTLDAARDLQQIGKKDDAIKLYKNLLVNYPGTEFDDAAKRALIQLNVDI